MTSGQPARAEDIRGNRGAWAPRSAGEEEPAPAPDSDSGGEKSKQAWFVHASAGLVPPAGEMLSLTV